MLAAFVNRFLVPSVWLATIGAVTATTCAAAAHSIGPSVALPPPINDDCSSPSVLVGPGPHAFDNATATTGVQGQLEAVCLFSASTTIEKDMWFTWTAPSTSSFAIDSCGLTTIDSKIAVYAGAGCPGAPALACNDDHCGLQSRTIFPATSGSVYLIQVGSFQGSLGGPGQITVTPVGVPPANDAMCSATPINEYESRKEVDSTNATTNSLEGASCASITGGQLQTDVWYCWSNTTTDSYHFTLSRCETSPPSDTMPSPGMILYSTNSCTTPCTPTNPVCGTSCSSTEFCITPTAANQQYLLRIGSVVGSGGTGGIVHLTIESGCPDSCITKTKILGTRIKTFDTGETTSGLEGQNNPGCYSPPGMDDDAWYEWEATQSGLVLVTTCGYTTVDTRIAVYAGVACPPGALVACDDDTCGTQAQVCFPATLGSHYTLQVGKTPGTPDGSVTFQVVELQPTTTCSTIAGRSYCAGDGVDPIVTTPCPCANFGAVGNGCANSANANGANLAAAGVSALDNVVLVGSGMPLSTSCIFLKGNANVPGGLVFGDGVRCLSGAFVRLRTRALSGGTASFPDTTDTVTLSARGGDTVGSGIPAYYGVYYRNAAALFCPPATFNITNGWEIIW
ncbi:MAG: hypothetical protein U1F29_12815 [Planctomycetota bacterium]